MDYDTQDSRSQAGQAGEAPQVLEGAPEPPGDAGEVPSGVTRRLAEVDAEDRMRRMSRRSFLWAAVAVAGGYGGARWLGSRRTDENLAWPLRRALQVNEELARDLSGTRKLSPTFAAWQVRPLRFNGDVGLGEDFDASQWELTVDGLGDPENPVRQVTLAQVKALPKVEVITELRCIEGWATVVRWGGARLSDFMQKFPPPTQSGRKFDISSPQDLPPYVGMATPDGAYYVGLEVEAALHPQTLLCYEMNGKPLLPEHGAPLRLAVPTKYGVKSIKRIGTITYAAQRPADYWAEQGYDYYAGH